MWENFISQLYENAQVNQDMKILLFGVRKNNEQKILNKLETKFTGWEKKINSLENKLPICKESKQLIKNLKRKPIKIKKNRSQKMETTQLKSDLKKFNLEFQCLLLCN